MNKYIAFLLMLSTANVFAQCKVTLSSKQNQNRSITISYEKDTPGSCCVYIEFKNLSNANIPLKKYLIQNSRGTLLTLQPLDSKLSIFSSYSYKTVQGIPDPKVDSSFVYALPFTPNTVVEARDLKNFGSTFLNREEPKNWRALQFIRSKPDTICAIRKGIVVEIIDKSAMDTTKNDIITSHHTTIKIEHEDGTFASYTGFDKDKIFAELGEEILPNQALGVLVQTNKEGTYQLRLTVIYLTEELTEDDKRRNRLVSMAYINPFFQTSVGVVQLVEKTKYITSISEDLIVKELSK
ncbi:MAG: hypothetical protein RIS47_181, partial [Bacteroidota bacterium]